MYGYHERQKIPCKFSEEKKSSMENLKNFYNKKNFVTGATGFKGSWLCSWLLKLGSKVYGTGNNPNKNKNLFYSLNLHKKIYLQLFDIRDYKKIYQLIKIKT